jgi:hypothetical protein
MEMDSPENQPEMPKKSGARKKELGPSEADLVIGYASANLVGSQGSLNILRHLGEVFSRDDKARREGTSKGSSSLEAYPLTEIEQFVRTDHASHLLKIAELEEYIKTSQQTTQIIDETDISGATLWDFIPDETKDEILNQLAGLRAIPNVKEALQTEMKGICSDTWDAHKNAKEGTEDIRFERLEGLIIGANPAAREKKDLCSLKSEILEAEEIHEMIALEKTRLTMTALLAPADKKSQREKEATSVMGEEFELIKAQVSWLEEALRKDTANAKAAGEAIGASGFISEPLQGVALFCPELQNRMENGPSEEQIEAMNKCYAEMAEKRDMEPSDRDKTAEKTAFCIGAMECVEMGKKARFINVLHQIGEVEKEKAKLQGKNPPPLPVAGGVPPPLPPMNAGDKKDKESLIQRGAGRILKQYPQMLAFGLLGGMKHRVMDDIKSHYGSMKDHVDLMDQHGIREMTDAM